MRTETLLIPMLAFACASDKNTETNTSGDDGGEEQTYDEWQSVRACAGDAPAADIAAEVALVAATEESLHEMVACGMLYYTIIVDLINVLQVMVTAGPDAVALTEGYTTDGAGQYRAAPAGSGSTVMDVRFFFGDDYTAGARGDLITHNLFDPDSYLTNVRVEVDPGSFELVLRYDEHGPLVELLGRGDSPRNPLRISADAVGELASELGKQGVDMDILVDDPREGGVITYSVNATPTTVESAALGERIDLAGLDLAATSAATGQDLSTLTWDLAYARSGAALNGRVDFQVLGGSFDYLGTWDWSASPRPVRTLSCP